MFKKSHKGFSIVELMIVVAIIGLLTAIVLPAVMRYHLSARQKACVNNLSQIDQAIQQWAMDTKANPTDVVTHSNIVQFFRILPVCPSIRGGSFYTDYGMTFVKEYPFCWANNGLAGGPHIFVSDPVPIVTTTPNTQPVVLPP